MRGVLSRECDDPAGAFNSEAREVLVGELLRADPAFCVHNHAVSQDACALDDRLAGNFARDPFNVGAAAQSISVELLTLTARVRVSATITHRVGQGVVTTQAESIRR